MQPVWHTIDYKSQSTTLTEEELAIENSLNKTTESAARAKALLFKIRNLRETRRHVESGARFGITWLKSGTVGDNGGEVFDMTGHIDREIAVKALDGMIGDAKTALAVVMKGMTEL